MATEFPITPEDAMVNLHAVSSDVTRLATYVPRGLVGDVVIDQDTSTRVRLGGVKRYFTDLARLEGAIFYGPESQTVSDDNVHNLFE